MEKNKPIGQHDVPATYLKRFSINPEDRGLKNMVYCLKLSNKNFEIKPISVKSKFFKTVAFYTLENVVEEDKYAIEEIFSNEIEPWYFEIVKEIKQEKQLSIDIRTKLVVWIWFSKYRTVFNRSNIERISTWLLKTKILIEEGEGVAKELEDGIKNYSKELAKDLQLESLFSQEHLEKFEKGIASKHWTILKSRNKNRFITNDNPGFSVEIELGKPKLNTLNVQFATNWRATNYYPISPNYCLMISPFWEGTPKEKNFYNIELKYLITNNDHIDFINNCTVILSKKYLVANKEGFLEKYKKETST